MSKKRPIRISVGKLCGTGDTVWHPRTDLKGKLTGKYWCGHWQERTAEQLLAECRSIILDLVVHKLVDIRGEPVAHGVTATRRIKG